MSKNPIAVLFALVILTVAAAAWPTPLDDFVNTPDPAFTYGPTPASTITGPDATAYIWHMASGTWRQPSEVDRTLWEHWVTVVVPNTLSHSKAMMVVSGGSNRPTPPTSVDSLLVDIAVATHSIVVNIGQIPNERLKFSDETDPRYITNGRNEDEIIAYAWDKFLRGGDPTWLPRLPMTRAVVRAMDLVQAEYPSVDGFLVAGASKRGQTTWTTGIVDPRAEAIIPIVIDYVNFVENLQHHWDAYGFWAPAVGDYQDMGIMNWLHTPQFDALCDVVDPYRYVDRLTQPKFIINSTGDQFFLPDASQFYFNALQGEKYLRYVPNTDHGVDSNPTALQDLVAYYEAFLNNTPRPQFTWTKMADGTLRVQTVTPPSAVRLWQAANPNARDFRMEEIGPAWTSSPLTDQGGGLYIGQIPAPTQGYAAFLVELEFPSGGLYPFHFTTEVSVVPDFLPYADSDGDTIINNSEGNGDPDLDGLPNYLDTNSDNDDITDKDETYTWHTDPYNVDEPDALPLMAWPIVGALLCAAAAALRASGRPWRRFA